MKLTDDQELKLYLAVYKVVQSIVKPNGFTEFELDSVSSGKDELNLKLLRMCSTAASTVVELVQNL
jgi:hypothetical protein